MATVREFSAADCDHGGSQMRFTWPLIYHGYQVAAMLAFQKRQHGLNPNKAAIIMTLANSILIPKTSSLEFVQQVNDPVSVL